MKEPKKPFDERAPYKKIAEAAVAKLLNLLSQYETPGDYEWPLESPIERILYTALWAEIAVGAHEHIFLKLAYKERAAPLVEGPGSPLGIYIEMQAQIGPYRVDFLLSTPIPGGHFAHLVVECDGHDFHEKTKEQAKRDKDRDRQLQNLGYSVFRFTGSEIWNDPQKCVDDIMNWAAEKTFPRFQPTRRP